MNGYPRFGWVDIDRFLQSYLIISRMKSEGESGDLGIKNAAEVRSVKFCFYLFDWMFQPFHESPYLLAIPEILQPLYAKKFLYIHLLA